MQAPTLSVVIPSYRDPFLHPTVQSLLSQSIDPIEIVVVLDGYWTTCVSDSRVRVVHLGANRGMRGAINAGVSVSRGRYIMRTDEHCAFGPGFDRQLTSQMEDTWIVYPMRYFLNPETWTVMEELAPNIYNKLVIDPGHGKFTSVKWPSRDKARASIDVDESMAMQGSCWVMARSWWDTVIHDLETDGYGPHYQDSVEMTMKTWQAGGHLMVNKTTWHAHKHRSFKRTHSYGGASARAGFAHALRVWGDYYRDVVMPRWGLVH